MEDGEVMACLIGMLLSSCSQEPDSSIERRYYDRGFDTCSQENFDLLL
jgi:hypothetical protein